MRAFTFITAVLVSAICLVLMIFLLAGSDYSRSLLLGSRAHITAISLTTGVVRLAFRRGGFTLSAMCGVVVAALGFFMVLTYVASRI